MSWWGPVAVVTLLAVGGGVGYAAASGDARLPDRSGTPTPASAVDPSIPTTQPGLVQPDAPTEEVPAIAEPFVMEEVSLGEGSQRITFEVPEGLIRNDRPPAEGSPQATWSPDSGDNPSGSIYSIRVELINDTITLGGSVASQTGKLRDQALRDSRELEILASDEDTLEVSVVLPSSGEYPGFRKYNLFHWIPVDDLAAERDLAQVEISISGREADAVGIPELMQRVAESVVRAPE